jgi:hypothetical protein
MAESWSAVAVLADLPEAPALGTLGYMAAVFF